jgi:hypothetical protein
LVLLINGEQIIIDYGNGASFTTPETITSAKVYPIILNGTNVNGKVFKPMIRLASETDATFAPYSNICPISGWDSVEAYVSPTQSKEDGTTYTATFDETVYGGTVDLVSGVLTVDRAYVDLGTLTWTQFNASGATGSHVIWGSQSLTGQTSTAPVCSQYQGVLSATSNAGAYAKGNGTCCFLAAGDRRLYVRDDNCDSMTREEFKAHVSGVQLVYELAEPSTIQLDPQTINTLVGVNNVWADSGDVSVEYGVRPGVLINPTQYESQPLIQIGGNGEININDYVISIDDSAIGDIGINATISNSLPSSEERYSSTLYSQATLDLSLLNDNDDLNWKGGNYRSPFNSRVFWSQGDTPPAGVSATSGEYITPYVVAYVPSGDFSKQQYFVGINVGEVPFKKGQYETITDNATITARYIVNGVTYTTAYTISAEFRYFAAYSGEHRIVLTLTISNSSQDYTGRYADWGYYYFISNPSFNGVSSKPIFSGDVIIDSETGDAYRIEDGTYISLNKYIQLGAQLPTLRPGANIITYDDTITSLNIAPRWWRL